MKSISFQKNHGVNVYDHGAFDIVVGDCGLYRGYPALNGVALQTKQVKVAGRGDQVTVTYVTKALELCLRFLGEKDRLIIQSTLRGLPGLAEIQSLDLFQKAYLVGYEKVVAHGFSSEDPSRLIRAADLDRAESYALTAVQGKQESLILGFLRHDQMLHTFTYTAGDQQTQIKCAISLAGKDLTDRESVALADLVIFSHANLDQGQCQWAQRVAKTHGVKLSKSPLRGWCSWPYDATCFSGDRLEERLETFQPYKDKMNLNVFVLEANWFPHLGDWLETHRDFPKGLESYAQQIMAAGYVPGVWISPGMVGARSRLCQTHPDWLCRDEKGRLIEIMVAPGEDPAWACRDRMCYALDSSHPAAFAYLRSCFRTLHAWGFRYFKTDFRFWGAIELNKGTHKSQPSKIKRTTPGKTAVEYFCAVLEMIRAEIGPESTWLGSGHPLWMSIGYVDALSIGRDVGPHWATDHRTQELLNDITLRNFTNNICYQVDPGAVLLRHFEHQFTDQEVTSLALFMGVNQGTILTGDPVEMWKKNRRELFCFIQADEKIQFQQPLLGRETDWVLFVGKHKDNGLQVIFALNPTNESQHKTFSTHSLGLPAEAHACFWRREKTVKKIKGEISLKLAPHQTAVLFVQDHPFKPGFKPSSISGS